ncbi:pectinesterase inhibitor 1-like [Henckelia pumila]|uniref:pectinesterase inhibitor 1-like n=1 Tax=Henckelia pumila TaxID=405737 RepID=UPI003C6E60C6
MPFSLDHKMIFLLLLEYSIVVVLLHAGLFATTNATLLETECSKANDPEFCLHVFGSDPASRAASSLVALARMGIDKATIHAVKTREDASERWFFSTEPKERNIMGYCVDEYDHALAALKAAPVSLGKKFYIDLYLRAIMRAQTAATNCEQMFISSSLPSPITRANVQFRDFCDILQVVANDLYVGGRFVIMKKLY